MAPLTARILVAALALALAIALMPAPALANDAARIAFLESEIQRLRSQLDEQNRRIQRLEAELDRRSGVIPAARAAPRPAAPEVQPTGPRPWHAPEAWARIVQGMTEAEVTGVLGEPTSIEAIEGYKTLFYRGATPEGRALAGHVNLREDRVVAVRGPD